MAELWLDYAWFALYPVWLIAGVGDYLCHRRTNIEATSGWRESAFHVAMMLQVAIPLLAILIFHINALIMAIVIAGALLHTATFYWDLKYTYDKRAITPAEQLVHTLLVAIPLFAASIVTILHWSERHDWSVRLKEQPVPAPYLVLILGAAVVLNLLPLFEEVWRTTRRAGFRAGNAAAGA